MAFCEEVVRLYRQEWAPKVPQLWYSLGNSAVECVLRHQDVEAAGGIVFRMEDPYLTITLPSGRKLWYFGPSLTWDEAFGNYALTYQSAFGGRASFYGGKICENVVQAIARDLLVEAMFRCEAEGHPVVLTVHDEIVCEGPRVSKDTLRSCMEARSSWAEALEIPVAAATFEEEFYCKE